MQAESASMHWAVAVDAAVLPGGAEADAAREGVVGAVLVLLDQRVAWRRGRT